MGSTVYRIGFGLHRILWALPTICQGAIVELNLLFGCIMGCTKEGHFICITITHFLCGRKIMAPNVIVSAEAGF